MFNTLKYLNKWRPTSLVTQALDRPRLIAMTLIPNYRVQIVQIYDGPIRTPLGNGAQHTSTIFLLHCGSRFK